MNILNKLTLAQLKENKKRTFLTGLSITIIMSLLTAIVVFLTGMRAMFYNQTVQNNGDWHFRTVVDTKQDLEQLQSASFVKDLLEFQGVPILDEDSPNKEFYGYAYKLNEETYNKQIGFFGKLSSGTLPTKPNEIAITKTSQRIEGSNFTSDNQTGKGTIVYKIGDNYPLHIGGALQYYKITGIISDYTANKWFFSENNPLPSKTIVLGHANHLDASFFPTLKAYNHQTFEYNQSVLATYGIFDKENSFYTDSFDSLKTMAYFVIGILSIISIMIITSSFMLSLNERLKQLGALASVGTTRRQIRYMLLMEGFWIGSISIICGIIIGIVGIGISINVINNILMRIQEDVIQIPMIIDAPLLAGIALLVTFIIVLSTLIPSIRATKRTAIENIKQVPFVRYIKMKQKTKTGKRSLAARVFKTSGHLAHNYKKFNSSRTRMIFIILTLSLISFNSITNLMIEMQQVATGAIQKGQPKTLFMSYDLVVMDVQNTADTKLYETAKNWTDVKEVMYEKYIPVETNLDILKQSNQTILSPALATVSEKEEAAILKLANISKEEFEKENVGILVTKESLTENTSLVNKETELVTFGPTAIDTSKINITILKAIDFTTLTVGLYPTETFLVSNKNYARMANILYKENHVNVYTGITTTKDADEKVTNLIKDTFDIEFITNTSQQVRSINGFLNIVQIIVYGFLSLVSILCLTATFNNVSSNIQLRRREFAMLRSIGMTTRQIRTMLSIENLQAGITSIIVAILCSIGLQYLFLNSITVGSMKVSGIIFHYPLSPTIISSITLLTILMLFNIFSIRQVTKHSLVEDIANETL
ncbi:FtsX-like permease family protein [Granulicatella sp. zg-ZJ]|uniref:ABC transporter permease n=1 Tax=Granulicatella sp. zg-ZJ TaxID=2678504 RepID=UPI0013CF6F73|nr:ABC transporter permease [Granulicatella sp. zg-ZJ]NEW63056.1 FtsX-like permease family protein [Granulicatella sp. zg-ZJ]